MAGAGYKLFNTGDVLTAAQVNTYLMEQTVMRFATTTARDTALSGVLAEGMLCYIDADNNIYKYTGAAWVNIDTGASSPLTTKGDLYTYSTADARLAVGNNGETLVADSSQTTGLRWAANYGFTAGKNKIINGDFRINQRAFSSTTANSTYGFDRWVLAASDGTTTYSAQTFTLGAAPVAGYEGTNFARIVSSGQTATSALSGLTQRIESVRTLAGQTATISFWAKASTGTPNVVVWVNQNFGSGGSPSSAVDTGTTKQAITTSWARYSFTVSVPSISGKTLGTAGDDKLGIVVVTSAGTDRSAYTDSIGIQSATIDIWGVQVEAGSVATAFQTATGTLAGELAACQRYYWRDSSTTATTNYHTFGTGFNSATNKMFMHTVFPVQMRIAPTATYLAAANYNTFVANALTAVSSFSADTANVTNITVGVNVATTPFTAGQGGTVVAANNKTAYIEYSSEL